MKSGKKLITTLLIALLLASTSQAQNAPNIIGNSSGSLGLWLVFIACIIPLIIMTANLFLKFRNQIKENYQWKKQNMKTVFSGYLKDLDKKQIHQFMKLKNKKCCGDCKGKGSCNKLKSAAMLFILLFSASNLFAQNTSAVSQPLLSQPGIIITLILMAIPILLGFIFAIAKATNALKTHSNTIKINEAKQFAEHLKNLDDHDLEDELVKRRAVLGYSLSNNELSGTETAEDTKGIIHNVSDKHQTHFTALKKKAAGRPGL